MDDDDTDDDDDDTDDDDDDTDTEAVQRAIRQAYERGRADERRRFDVMLMAFRATQDHRGGDR